MEVIKHDFNIVKTLFLRGGCSVLPIPCEYNIAHLERDLPCTTKNVGRDLLTGGD